ncbi:helix-turn-helix domain-containing protein [Marinoscillum sp.]|uniref:helix-turn-helix domain-containing protein n=1 Tax=Marinoscillum sp. TaxID=2024838 RepID=UPI003BA8D2C8
MNAVVALSIKNFTEYENSNTLTKNWYERPFNMTISSSQARAARAFLGLSQQEVANATGLEKNDISRLEKGRTVRAEKANRVIDYYKGCLRFTANGGVEPIPDTEVKILSGELGFKEFMNDVYEVARLQGGDICIFNSKPALWYKWLTKEWYEMHALRMQKLGNAINVKIIVQQGEDFLILKSACHRQYPKELYAEKIFYIYGTKLAFLDFSEDQVEIKIFNQSEFADIQREIFGLAWDQSAPINASVEVG